jgi:hypothetical protein
MTLKQDGSLSKWIVEALKAHGGSASIVEICKHIWRHHESDLRKHHRELRTRRTTPAPSSSSTSHDNERVGSTRATSTNIDSLLCSRCAAVPRSLRLHKSNVLSDRPWEEQNSLRLCPPRSNCETNSRHSLAVRRVPRGERTEPFNLVMTAFASCQKRRPVNQSILRNETTVYFGRLRSNASLRAASRSRLSTVSFIDSP